jgi:hypothetical protein
MAQRFRKDKGTALGRGTANKSYYVRRKKDGTIKKWTSVGSSLKADKRSGVAVNTPKKKRQGNLGDYQAGGIKRSVNKFLKKIFG